MAVVLLISLMFFCAHSIILINEQNNETHEPIHGYNIGSADILDEIHIEFDIMIHLFPSTNISSILHFGNTKTEKFPQIYIHSNQRLYVEFSAINNNYKLNSDRIKVCQWYHLSFIAKHDSITFIFDDSTTNYVLIHSHSNLFDRFIYLSDPWHESAAGNVHIRNLQISSSNDASFNYLCDYSNRFTDNGRGEWSVQSSTCQVTQSTLSSDVLSWMGEADPSSLNWTDYELDLILSVESDQYGGLQLHQQTMNDSVWKAYEVSLELYGSDTTVRMYKIDNGDSLLQSYDTLLNHSIDYHLKVVVVANNFTIYLDDEYLFDYTDVDNTFHHGSVALFTWKSMSIFKSLQITFKEKRLIENNNVDVDYIYISVEQFSTCYNYSTTDISAEIQSNPNPNEDFMLMIVIIIGTVVICFVVVIFICCVRIQVKKGQLTDTDPMDTNTEIQMNRIKSITYDSGEDINVNIIVEGGIFNNQSIKSGNITLTQNEVVVSNDEFIVGDGNNELQTLGNL